MIKNCQGCTKTFFCDQNIKVKKKFCSKQCYLNLIRNKSVVFKIEEKKGFFDKVRDMLTIRK